LPNGQIDLDPTIAHTIEVFRAHAPDPNKVKPEIQTAYRQLQAQGLDPQALALAPGKINVGTFEHPIWIILDVQPTLVQVPKRPISMAFGDRE
jgi:hypothetical protein